MGVHISSVKSLLLDEHCWKGELLQFMLSKGNKRCNAVYEAKVPPGYFKPSEYENRCDVRENYVRAKWERKEFMLDYNPRMCVSEGTKEGYLYKKSANLKVKSWQKRWFVLNGICLSYYKNPSDDMAKGVISLHESEIKLSDKYNSITCDDTKGKTSSNNNKYEFEIVTRRRTFCIRASSMREMFDWAHALSRAVELQKISVRSSGVKTGNLNKAPKDLAALEDYLSKSAKALAMGSSRKSGPIALRESSLFGFKWSWRWANLIPGALVIFASDTDKEVVTTILLENSIVEMLSRTESKKEYSFAIRTYNRQIFLATDCSDVLSEWIEALSESRRIPTPCPESW
jgi:hypothetical protein